MWDSRFRDRMDQNTLVNYLLGKKLEQYWNRENGMSDIEAYLKKSKFTVVVKQSQVVSTDLRILRSKVLKNDNLKFWIVIFNHQEHEPSSKVYYDIDFRKVNKLAAIKGAKNAAENSEFIRQNLFPDQKPNETASELDKQSN